MTSLPASADVVVAGCGIVGMALAWRLARSGLKVVALDAAKAGGSTSAGTFAWINGTSKTESEAYHRLNRAGLDAYERLARQVGAAAIGLGGSGSLEWASAEEPATHEAMRAQIETLRRWDYPAEWVDADAMRRLAPGLHVPDGSQGLFAPADRWIDVPRLLDWLRAELMRLGGRLLEHCPVVALQRGPDGGVRSVETPLGRIACSRVAIVAGTATPRLVEMATGRDGLPVEEVPGLLVETAPAPLAPGFDLVLWAPDAAGFHLRRTGGGGLLLGADDIDAEIAADASKVCLARASAELVARAVAWMPALSNADLARGLSHRIGRRAVPADGHSILGPLSETPGAYVAVTHSGVTLALWIAELLGEEIVTGRMPTALAPFRPARFGF
jgi:glycine/D-amino acid oxidase-like deaminating enzyme